MIIIDNAISDETLLAELQDDQTDCWHVGFSWWSGKNPSTLRHRLIDHLWKDKWYSHYMEGISGFEHWCGIYDNQDYRYQIKEKYAPGHNIFALNHHLDSDEYLHKRGENVHPKIGTIIYPKKTIDDCKGGYLRIYDSKKRYAEYSNNGDPITEPYELIRPKFNRLVIFDASQLHAVEQVTKGIRHAIAINLWDTKLSQGQLDTCVEVIE
jgi:hypothetical protein